MRRAAVVLTLALAGCGSSGPHLSKAEYVRRADAICGRYQAAITRLGQPTKISEIGPYIAKALPALSKAVDDLGRLAPPSDLESQFRKFMGAARDTVTRAKALRAAASAADGNQVQRLLNAAAKAGSGRTALAHAAAIDGCALQ